MAGISLDGAGQAKMATLDNANMQVTRLHAIVEGAAMQVKNGKPIIGLGQQFRRAAAPLVGLLKPQFALIADIVTGMILISSRGGGDQARIRSMREGIGQLKVQLEISVNQTKEKHAMKDHNA